MTAQLTQISSQVAQISCCVIHLEYLSTREMQSIMEKVDPELEVKIKEGEKLIAQMVQDQLRPTYTFNDKTWDASSLNSWLRYLNAQKDCLTYLVKQERKKMDLLLLLLDKLRCADNAYRKKPIKECLSVQEMNKHNIRCQMVHGSKNIRKEKKLLKDVQLNPQEDKFVSFWTQLEKELKRVSQVERFYHVKPTWLLHHQMPALFITEDEFKYREEEISELEWRIQRCGVELVNKGDEGIATHKANAKSTANGKTWTSLVSKKELQEQLKVAGTRIEELRKTQLTLGLGKVISQVEREREAMYRDLSSFRKRFPKLCQSDSSRVLKPKGQRECSYMRLDDLSFFYY